MSPSTPDPADNHDLAALEVAVIQLQLADDTQVCNLLRAQWGAAVVVKRERTGVGFYTTFAVPSTVPAVPDDSPRWLGDVYAEIQGLDYGAGFILWIEDGRLNCLEGHSYEDRWPQLITGFRVSKDRPKPGAV
jgi:hypothetical protein